MSTELLAMCANSLEHIESQNEMIINELKGINAKLAELIEETRLFHGHFIEAHPMSMRRFMK